MSEVATPYMGAGAEEEVLPPIGSYNSTFWRQFIDRRIYYTHRLRTRDVARARRAELYDQCMQWLWRAHAGYDTGGTTSQWVEAYWQRGDPNYIPTPVFNEGLGARQNESARLAAPNPKPIVNPRSRGRVDLKTRMGAKRATDSSRHRLEVMEWEREAWILYYHMPLYGGAWVRSEWVESWAETTMIPVVGAVGCRQCGFTLADANVRPADAQRPAPWLGTEAAPVGQPVRRCPTCPEHPPLQQFQPTMEEASHGQDAMGRPLGREVPLGDWMLSVRSPYDMFPANLGIGRNPRVGEVTEVSVEKLDDIALRFPDRVEKVRPESAAMLANFHPVAGSPDLFHAVMDAYLFRDSARLKQWSRPPWMERIKLKDGQVVRRMNDGRRVVMAGNEVLLDAPYLIDSVVHQGEKVESIKYEYIPWELRDGANRLQGLGLWDVLFDAQDIRNETVSQTQSVRQRLAVPIYLTMRDNNWSMTQIQGGIPGRRVEIDPHPDAPTFEPKLINNETINPGVAQEGQDAVDFIERAGGLREVEKGGVPPGVAAAQAIRLLKAAAAEGRQPRVDRINQALRRLFKHGVELQNHLYLEPRTYKYEGDDGEEVWDAAKGLDFENQTDVEIEAEPTHDEKLRNLETVREHLTLLLPNASRSTTRKILGYLDVPDDLMKDDKLSEASAQREWISFRDDGRPPIVDPGLDSHIDHHEDHGRRCHTEHFRKLEEAAGWDQVLAKTLSGQWRMLMQQIQQMAMWPQPQPQLDEAGQPVIDTATGQPVFLPPPSIQDQIIAAWGEAILKSGFQPPNPEALQQVLRWRAHMEAHKLHEEIAQMTAMMQPTLAQPGSEETSSGGQPTPQAPPELGGTQGVPQ